MKIRNARAAILTAILVAATAPASAQSTGEFSTKAPNAILMDASTGSVLFQQAADELVPTGSMSKLMTLAVLFKALKDGKVKMEDEFQTSEHAWRTGGAPSGTAAMFIPINNKTPVSELIQGIIVQSGNDACITVAEGLGGTVPKFAKMMEEEARRIGLKKSTFRNATGFYDPEHLMTAREVAKLLRYIIQEYPEQYKIFSQKEFPYRKHKFYNRNPLLGTELGVDGLVAGFTNEGGFGMALSAMTNFRRLIAVVTGLGEDKERRDEARRLLEWGFKNFDQATLFDAGEVVGYARVWGGTEMYVPLTGKDGPLTVVLPRISPTQKLRGEIQYKGPLKPPVKKGDEVATFRVTTMAGASSEVPLYAGEDVPEGSFVSKGLDSIMYLALRQVGL